MKSLFFNKATFADVIFKVQGKYTEKCNDVF